MCFWQGGLSAAPARAVSAVKNMNLPEIPRNINIGDINIKVPSLSPFWVCISDHCFFVVVIVLTFIAIDTVSLMPFMDSWLTVTWGLWQVQRTLQGPIIYSVLFFQTLVCRHFDYSVVLYFVCNVVTFHNTNVWFLPTDQLLKL